MSANDFYIDPGYVDEGYFFTPLTVALISGATRVNLRCPSSRSGTVQVLQPQEISGGWERVGYPAFATVHSLALQYDRLNGTERTDLESLLVTVDGAAKQFTYLDALTGYTNTVQFQSPDLDLDHAGYDLYKTALNLWSLQTFFQLTGTPPDINSGDTILTRLHYPGQYKSQRKQPGVRMSNGSMVIYRRSEITRHGRTVALLRRTYAEMAALIYFFVNIAVGMRNKFNWTFEGSVRSIRFADSTLSWRQSSARSDMYDASVTLEEDL